MTTAFYQLKTEYPVVRTYPIQKGDRIFLYGDPKVKVGQPYRTYPAIVSKVWYWPRPWWKFWEKKKIYGFEILWIADGGKME